ncbi:MAG: hypothetical protein MK132_03925 [Lentisphaerales bacterium]|nr:hypothetical protein [Lentisphaerales bacterium]
MRDCYITKTASFLPGTTIENDSIEKYLGSLDGESTVRDQVLSMNGIKKRYYAQDKQQKQTYDLYDLAAKAALALCQDDVESANKITFMSAGTTYSPLAAPGLASILHDKLQAQSFLDYPVEISSHSGICTSGAAALVGGIRAIESGQHNYALCVSAEHPSAILKEEQITPIDDRSEHKKLRDSKWFMSVFLRYMLSDGAGALALADKPIKEGLSLRVNWTHSRSFANAGPLCMKLDNSNALLSQDLSVLTRYLFVFADSFIDDCLKKHNESLDNYSVILPHMSSFFFRKKMEKLIAKYCINGASPTPYWTNLADVGNTGSASIYIMLDQYVRDHKLEDGQRILLFIPESGQFNFVMISLTVVLS